MDSLVGASVRGFYEGSRELANAEGSCADGLLQVWLHCFSSNSISNAYLSVTYSSEPGGTRRSMSSRGDFAG